jgi:hypothetical protein
MEPTPSVAERIIQEVPEVGRRRGDRVTPADHTSAVVDLTDPPAVIDLSDLPSDSSSEVIALVAPVSEDGCGLGSWCDACREEIRQEALAWIRDLNATSDRWEPAIADVRRITGDIWSRPI